jgi:hypothetical protein
MRSQPERGSILVEVVFLMVLLILPVFYLVGTLGRLQAGAYAVSASAREAGRAYATAPEAARAPGRAASAARLVLESHGFTAREGSITVTCDLDPCPQPGAEVRVAGSVQVELPLIPDFASGVVPTSVELNASHLETVDEFREP